jgi:serine/threonine protein kinase
MALVSGAKLGLYETKPLLGAGGMGEVYRARDTRLGRDVALEDSAAAPFLPFGIERTLLIAKRAPFLRSIVRSSAGRMMWDIRTFSLAILVMEYLEGHRWDSC